MRDLFYVHALALCAVLPLAAWSAPAASRSGVSVTLPTSQVTFRPGPGSDVTSARCTVCHSADYVYIQPPMERAKWEAVVKKMQKVFGCPMDEDAIKTVVDYLAQQNGPRK